MSVTRFKKMFVMSIYCYLFRALGCVPLSKNTFFFTRTSNFAAEVEPKLNVLMFFFHVLNLKRSYHVLELRGVEFQKTEIYVTRKP